MEQPLYIRIRGKVQGPFSPEKLQAMARRGQFSRLHEVSEDGAKWVRASTYPDLFVASAVVPIQRVTAPASEQPAAPTASNADGYSLMAPEEQPLTDDSPPASPREQSWYYSVGSTQQGPVGFAMLQMLASTGQLAQDELVWSDGMQEWTPAAQVPGLARSPAAPSTGVPTPAAMYQAGALPRASGLAIASLILGILGLLPLFGVGSLIAVIFGHVSLAAIHRSNGMLTGGGMAVAGLILGYLVVVPVLAYLLFMLVLVIIGAITAGAGAAGA